MTDIFRKLSNNYLQAADKLLYCPSLTGISGMFTSYQILQVDSIELLDQMISTSLGQNLQMPAESSATAVNDNNRTEIASYGVPQKSKQYNNSSPLSGYSYLTNKTHSENEFNQSNHEDFNYSARQQLIGKTDPAKRVISSTDMVDIAAKQIIENDLDTTIKQSNNTVTVPITDSPSKLQNRTPQSGPDALSSIQHSENFRQDHRQTEKSHPFRPEADPVKQSVSDYNAQELGNNRNYNNFNKISSKPSTILSSSASLSDLKSLLQQSIDLTGDSHSSKIETNNLRTIRNSTDTGALIHTLIGNDNADIPDFTHRINAEAVETHQTDLTDYVEGDKLNSRTDLIFNPVSNIEAQSYPDRRHRPDQQPFSGMEKIKTGNLTQTDIDTVTKEIRNRLEIEYLRMYGSTGGYLWH